MSRSCESVARRSRARCGRRCGLLACVLASAVLSTGSLKAAGSAEAVLEGGVPVGAAPVWPFRGLVHYGWNVLEYWDAEAGARSQVRLGHPWGCPFPVKGNEEYVEVASWPAGGGRDVILRVPWGDEAYPYFARSEDVPLRIFKQTRDLGVEVSVVPEGFRVATAEGEAYYRRSGDYASPRLVRTGGSLAEHLEAVGVDPGEGYEFFWHYGVELDGTDGFHYGFRLVHPEPNCPDEEGFIVAGDTGEVVACGLGRGGAWLVLPEGSQPVLARFALPRWTDCDSSEAWHVGLRVPLLPLASGG